MRLKSIVFGGVAIGYLAMLFACNTAPAGLTKSSKAAATNTPTAVTSVVAQEVTWPHAADTSGKMLPDSSTVQPDKPIILGKDSENAKQNSGELKPEAAFDHVKHATLATYSLSGTAPAACVDCHHTDQPSAPAGQAFLKKFDRKAVLTTKELETSKQAVKTCRACHLQASEEETEENPPASITYPEALGRPPSGKLNNEIAYHLNCNTCHDAVKKRDPKIKAPQTCVDCHTNK